SFHDDEQPRIWSEDRKTETVDQRKEIAELLEALALQIYPDIEKNSACTKPAALEKYIAAIHHLKEYFEIQDEGLAEEALNKALECHQEAGKAEIDGELMSPLLPVLLARSCLVQKRWGDAHRLSEKATNMMDPTEESVIPAAWWVRGMI